VTELNEQEWKEWLKEQEIPFEVNDWGSCQYSTAKWFFDTFLEMVKDLSLEKALNLLKCKVKFDATVTLADVISDLVDIFKGQINYDLAEEDYDDIITVVGHIKQLKACVDGEGIFKVLKEAAWDLWAAADVVAHNFFTNLVIEAPDSPGYGPKLNELVQSDNFRTGLCCALLVHHGFILNSEAFAGFDT